MALKDLPGYKDIRGSIRRRGRYPYVGTKVKDTIVVHHSMTKMALAGSNPNAYANTHIDVNGWHGCAYPFVIQPDGTIYQTDDLDRRTYHAGNTNTRSVGVCLSGDFRTEGAREKPTQAQINSLYRLVKELKKILNISRVLGHQECPGYSWKNCPGNTWNYRDAINGKTTTGGGYTPTPTPSGTYTIQQGDTFYSISKGIPGVSMKDIEKANPKVDPKKLKVGQKIKLPKSSPGTPTNNNPVVKPSPSPSRNYLELGDRGNAVKTMQNLLIKANYNIGSAGADGIFGKDSESALKRFQKNNGLVVDGLYGPSSEKALQNYKRPSSSSSKKKKTSLPDATYVARRPFPSGTGVRQVQQALVKLNFYPNKNAKNNGVDSVYGGDTSNAVYRFQLIHMGKGDADGKYGPKTRKAMLNALG